MPLILAIEPDRRQAAHLAGIARHYLSAELILADTTEGALDAIGDRVPDLVLVPALLSPQDDAALAAALRVIAAAAHVRTLTIPVLSNGVTRAPASGLFAKWRRGRTASPEPDGCDPAVFSEQISAYLAEAAAAREELVVEPPPSVAPPAESPVEAVAIAPPLHEPMAEAIPEPPDKAAAELWTVGAIDEIEEPVIDLSDAIADLSDEDDGDVFDGEPVGVYTISADPEPDPAAVLEPDPQPVLEPVVAPALVLAREEPVELVIEEPRADIEPWVPMYLTAGRLWPALEGVPSETPTLRTEQPDWIELVASLRQDLERRKTDPAATDPMAARPSDGAESDVRALKKSKAPSKKTKPIQDEWGFFDPEQCGFSTLLAKLEEITEEEVRS